MAIPRTEMGTRLTGSPMVKRTKVSHLKFNTYLPKMP